MRSDGQARDRRHSLGSSEIALSRVAPAGKRARLTQGRSLGDVSFYIGDHPLLTGREELDLARRLEKAEISLWRCLLGGSLAEEARGQLLALDPPVVARSAGRARAADFDRLVAASVIAKGTAGVIHASAEELIELRSHAAEADRIRDRFVTCNLRLVPSTILRRGYHHSTSLSMSDLIQEGNLGLLKAIPRFDYRRKLRFSTFATWWIRHFLVRARQNLGDEVRVPVHMHDLASRARRAKADLRGKLGRDPNQGELAAALKTTKKSLAALDGDWLKRRESLPAFDSVGEDGERPLYLASDAPSADEFIADRQDVDRITTAVARMSPMFAQIVRRHFGLDGSEPETLKQIGQSMNLSRERIRQLEVAAIAILRRALTEDRSPTRPKDQRGDW